MRRWGLPEEHAPELELCSCRAQVRKVSSEKRLVELTLITTKDGENTDPLERLADGSLIPLTVEAPPPLSSEAPAQATA